MTVWERMAAANARLDGLPRKCLLIFLVLVSCYMVVILFPYFMPFFAAIVIAMLMDPLVRPLRRLMAKWRAGNALATLLGMLLIYGLIGFIIIIIGSLIGRELTSLAHSMPGIVRSIRDDAERLAAMLQENFKEYLPESFNTFLDTALSELTRMLTSFAATITRSFAGGAFATAASIPNILLVIVLTIMGSFYISYDRERIFAFFRRVFPQPMVQGAVSLKKNIFSSMFGQMKTQCILSVIVTVTVTLGLLIMKRDYWLLFGLLLGLADLLPIIGVGLILFPWSAVSFFNGDVTIGIGMLVLSLLVTLIRQVAEPRLSKRHLGLYPLAMMMSFYAGYKLMGFVGMLTGPIILNIIKLVLAADQGIDQIPEQPRRRLFRKIKSQQT
jgi:sporulation integral membrane protein YtvI